MMGRTLAARTLAALTTTVLTITISTAPSQAETTKENESQARTTAFKIVINKSNPTPALPRAHIAKMFRRQIKSWDDLDLAVMPIDLKEDAPVRAIFSRVIHDKRVSSISEFWLRMIFSGRGEPPPRAASDSEVLAYIRRHRGAIGYIADVTPLGPGVKTLEISD